MTVAQKHFIPPPFQINGAENPRTLKTIGVKNIRWCFASAGGNGDFIHKRPLTSRRTPALFVDAPYEEKVFGKMNTTKDTEMRAWNATQG
jgi:hypothetical protein